MDERAVLSAIDAGARVVVFDTVACLVHHYVVSRRRYLVFPGETPQRVGLLAIAATALLGWWGVALLQTPVSLYRNVTGGVDVTDEVRVELESRLALEGHRAEVQAEVEASLTPDLRARRAQAQTLVERGELEQAWALVGDDATRTGSPLARDLPLLRGFMTLLHDRRQWSRAGRVADTLRREFPEELCGYLATMVRRVEERSSVPDGATAPQPWWVIPLVIVVAVAAAVYELRKAWR